MKINYKKDFEDLLGYTIKFNTIFSDYSFYIIKNFMLAFKYDINQGEELFFGQINENLATEFRAIIEQTASMKLVSDSFK